MRHRHSDYMHWAKTQSCARYNLATSGVGSYSLRDLPFQPDALEINGDNSYGYVPLKKAIAQKQGVDPDCVVTAAGTSFANHLAMAALIDPGDEVLIESPAYELLVSTALFLGAGVKRFERSQVEDYRVDPTEISRRITPKTRLIVITNLHNPTSVLTSNETLREVGNLARSAGARVLVDEVYLDFVYDNPPATAYLLGPEFVVTNSLTKVYGLSGLRCGWILAEPELARRMWQLNDLFAATPSHPAELLSVIAFQNLDTIRAKARRVIEADRAALGRFLSEQNQFTAPRTAFGSTAFLRLLERETAEYLETLRTRLETSAVPGRFFDAPNCFRVGMGVNAEMFEEGLRRLARNL